MDVYTNIHTYMAGYQDVSASTIAEAMEILQGMKDAIEARLLAIDAAIKEADDNLAADKANKLKYQIDIVTLSNTADKEKSNANTGVCVCACVCVFVRCCPYVCMRCAISLI